MKSVEKSTLLADGLTFHRRAAKNQGSLPAGKVPGGLELIRLFDRSLDLLCVAGLDGYFKYLNPAWTTLLGWNLEELQAAPFLDFVHPEDLEATQAEVGKLSEGTATSLFENRYRHRDGSFRWLQWNARSTPGERLIYAAARDVTRQRLLERQVLEIADREKERLGRELHDGLCQTLAGIAALSSTLSRTVATSSAPAASARAAEITQLLNESIDHARDLARGLGPFGPTSGSFWESLDALTLSVGHLFDVSCSLRLGRPLPRLCREREGHLFRIAQEAVNNAISHGRADWIEIELRRVDDRGRLIIRDNGGGLSDRVGRERGSGLRTMNYRARLIGGSLVVRPRPHVGTAVACEFPLTAVVDGIDENPRRELDLR